MLVASLGSDSCGLAGFVYRYAECFSRGGMFGFRLRSGTLCVSMTVVLLFGCIEISLPIVSELLW